MSKKILMVVTSSERIISTNQLTGVWLEEFALPYLQFQTNGYEVTVASPKGGKTPIDPRSEPPEERAQEWAQARAALNNTLNLDTVKAADYAAIFMPGGHGTMFDLPGNPSLQQLLRDFAEQDKILAAVCHGPAGLVGATLSDGRPIVAGKTITAFTDSEERAAGMDKDMPFLLETSLTELGANFVRQPDWTSHVERDGKLITGQNPQSSARVAQAVIEALASVVELA